MDSELPVSGPHAAPAAVLVARRGVGQAALSEALGIRLPDGPAVTLEGAVRAIGQAPHSWLLIGEATDLLIASRLRRCVTGLASVFDQSSAYLFWRLSGNGARPLLQRGAAIDLHPAAFRTGSAATTWIAHIDVVFWQIDDAPTFEVAVFRSFASDFQYWLAAATKADAGADHQPRRL